MTTFNELINEVAMSLSGYTMRQDRTTHLTGAINTTDKTISVDSVSNISKGLIEVGDELMWVDSFDQTAKTLTVAPYGRGYFGTPVTSKPVDTKVTIAPTYPRASIKRAINEAIMDATGPLYGVAAATIDYSPAVTTYTLPEASQDILAVSYEDVGPTKEWFPVRRWRVDKTANASAFNSTQSISIYDVVPTVSTVQVVYSFDPAPLEFDDDDFELTTGLSTSAKNVITLGARYKLLSDIDSGRGTFTSPEADAQTARVPYGAVASQSKYVYALYQQRLQDEASRLRDRYPVRVHYTR